MNLGTCDSWIFDMDGTLTIAVHDFDAIRQAIGLPAGEPILEALDRMSPQAAAPLRLRLDEIEFELAKKARPAPGAEALLGRLRQRGANLGILTRNGVEIAYETLRCCGLADYFEEAHVVGRELARPKPDPDGVHQLLSRWGVAGERAVMVGEYYFDLAAGRAAGTATIYFDPRESREWSAHAYLTVSPHDQITSLLDESDSDSTGMRR